MIGNLEYLVLRDRLDRSALQSVLLGPAPGVLTSFEPGADPRSPA